MRSKLFLMFVVLLVCLFPASAQTINENESTMALKDKSAEISLAVESVGKTSATGIDLELLDAEGKVRANASQSFGLKKGKNICKISMPLGDLIKNDEDDIYWFRLQYRIDGRQGVISLSELLKDIFELRASVPKNFSTGTTYRVRVRALNPFSLKAVKGVQVDGEFSVDIETDSDEDELKLTASGQTDGKGFVVLDFKIPQASRSTVRETWTSRGKRTGSPGRSTGTPSSLKTGEAPFSRRTSLFTSPAKAFTFEGYSWIKITMFCPVLRSSTRSRTRTKRCFTVRR